VPGPRSATISPFLEPFLVLAENAVARQGVVDLVAGNLPMLFLAGPTGTGKSHLLHELVDRWRATHPRTTVLHYDAAKYSEEFSKAAAEKKTAAFQKKTDARRPARINPLRVRRPGPSRPIGRLRTAARRPLAVGTVGHAASSGSGEPRGVGATLRDAAGGDTA
jgi:hypothetical protein